MGNFNPEIDDYIAKCADFARPILERLRKLFHRGCPQVEETLKWGAPHFEYKGILGGMAAFKKHVRWGFWKGRLLDDPEGIFIPMDKAHMGFANVSNLSDLPSDKAILAYILQAVALNEQGVKAPAAKKKPRPALEAPDYFLAALKKNKKALAAFEAFSPSNKRDYIEWITEAKQEETRQKRLATALEWMAEGKPRNWKYMRKWSVGCVGRWALNRGVNGVTRSQFWPESREYPLRWYRSVRS